MKRLFLILLLSLPVLLVPAQTTAFDRLLTQAQRFAHDFPREKVYLHFDNSSYYQGDTIWYKAYVVTSSDLQPSLISKPLYVELVDPLGNVVERQIVKLDKGEGHGQFSLSSQFFTGYFEVRAYTKWMLAFSEPQCFSRTFPIFRKRLRPNEPRSIATYRMDKSMKQRPGDEVEALTLRFFPEGGHLVEGITSRVGMEALSRDSGRVNIEGVLTMPGSGESYTVATVHDGMGSFNYIPRKKPATVEVTFAGKKHHFTLPEAEPQGYVLTAVTHGENIDVLVSRSSSLPDDSLAVFLFSEGIPQTYAPVRFNGTASRLIRIVTSSVPAGVVRLSLVNTAGLTLADRFCYVMPHTEARLSAVTDKPVYGPFDKVTCRLRLTTGQGQPVRNASVSVSVTNASSSDYLADADNICTDLLLTSDLKGYIPHPGFYFLDRSNRRMRMLDDLLLIRGWRKYDLSKVFGLQTFQPAYLPENRLMLYGHVNALLRGVQKNLGVTVMARRDSLCLSGATTTDSLGNFSIPLDDFTGSLDALIQTRKDGKKQNRETTVTLKRNFDAPLRPYDFDEMHPKWADIVDTASFGHKVEMAQALPQDSDVHQLAGIIVKGKFRNKNITKETESFERDIVGFYNIRQIVDRLRDEGKPVRADFGYLMHTINPAISEDGKLYNTTELKYSVGGRMMEQQFFNGYINAIETAMLYLDRTGSWSYGFDKNNFRIKEQKAKSYWSDIDVDTVQQTKLSKMYVRCDLTMEDRWDANKNYIDAKGLRRTLIQGYNAPAAFYSPSYAVDSAAEGIADRRRTLYWNPDMKTDDKGEIVVTCYNGSEAAAVGVSAEGISNGVPAAVLASSCPPQQPAPTAALSAPRQEKAKP